VAGNSRICNHVAGLLFVIAERISVAKYLLNEQSITDIECSWSKPKSASVEPKPVSEVHLSLKAKNRLTAGDELYRKNITKVNLTPSEEERRATDLFVDAMDALKECPFVKGLDLGKFKEEKREERIQYFQDLPDMFIDDENNFSTQLIIHEVPSPISEIAVQKVSVDDSTFLQVVRDSIAKLSTPLGNKERRAVEDSCIGQSSNPMWYRQRSGSVTASKIHRVLGWKVETKLKLVAEVLKNRKPMFDRLPLSMQWGLKNESLALSHYSTNIYLAGHKDFTVSDQGLCVHPDYPFIRASPDALATCCCGSRIVEVKCPWNIRHQEVTVALVDYLEEEHGQVKLNKKVRGYYDQVITNMACSGLTRVPAHFVVWSTKNHLVVEVPFDEEHWNFLASKASLFFTSYIVPSLVAGYPQYVDPVELETEDKPMDTEDGGSDSEERRMECEGEDQEEDREEAEDNNLEIEDEAVGNAEEFVDLTGDVYYEEEVTTEKIKKTVWHRGCEQYCKNDKCSNSSSTKYEEIACDANIVCKPNSWFHLFCEGFHRRMPAALMDKKLKTKYVCKLCRPMHDQAEELEKTSGFLFMSEDDDDCMPIATTYNDRADILVRATNFSCNEDDVHRLINGEELNDSHINSAQHMLKAQFPLMGGFLNTIMSDRGGFEPHEGEFVQIVHVRDKGHWSLVTNVGCHKSQIKVYDSAFRSISPDLKKILDSLMPPEIEQYEVLFPKCQAQTNAVDCGLFCIAFALAICRGDNISKMAWEDSKLRDNFYEFLDNKYISDFDPCKPEYAIYKFNAKFKVKVDRCFAQSCWVVIFWTTFCIFGYFAFILFLFAY